jgi:uncharacterized protein
MRFHQNVAGMVLLTLLAFAVIAPASAAPLANEQPLTFGLSYQVQSAALNQSRRINVSLPDGYDDPDETQVRYPVLYLLDGGAGWQDFFHIAAMVRQGGLWGGNAPLIVVGIESVDRRAEFTRPSSDPAEQKDFPTHGKAEAFRNFIVNELKPEIDARFRTTGEDGLIGESLAGLLVVDTFLRHGADFDRYIAISPSLWWNGARLSADAEALLKSGPTSPRTIWLSMADEGGAMQTGMDRLVSVLGKSGRPEVVWTYTPFPQESHATIYHPAATRAVRQVYPAPKPVK